MLLLVASPQLCDNLSCIVIWIDMVCGVVGTCLILVRVVPGFCTYQWEVQKCTIETYKSGARLQIMFNHFSFND